MMDVAQYVIGSLMWSVFGLATGYLLGHMEREVHAIKTTVVDGAPPEGRARARAGADLVRRNFGMLVLLLALLSLAQMTAAIIDNRRQMECQNTVNRELRAQQVNRGVLADADWRDIREFLRDLEEHIDDPAAARRDLSAVNDALAARASQRSHDPQDAYIADEC